MESEFDHWADVYDTVYAYVDDDIPFYVNAAMESGSTVLELGCGTGRIAIPIALAGIDVIGIDTSKRMLKEARLKAADLPVGSGGIELIEADMRGFSFQRKFDTILIPFRGFLSLLTVEDQLETLMNIKNHLTPEGRFMFSVFVPHPESLLQETKEPYHFRDVMNPKTGRKTVLWQQNRYQHHDQIVFTRVIGEELDINGFVVNRFFRDFQLRYAHRWEIHHLLKSCGFEMIALYGDFDESDFDYSSNEMIWVVGIQK